MRKTLSFLRSAIVKELCLLIFLASYSIIFAQEKNEFNPADPTAAATNIQFIPEFNKSDDYNAYGLRINYDRDWAGGLYSVNIEAAYGTVDFFDGDFQSGITDIRTRFFWKFYEKKGEALQNMVFNLDVFIPVGDAEKGFGIGTFQLVPGVIFAFPLSEAFEIFPNPRIQFSTGKTAARTSAFQPGRNPFKPRLESEEYIFAFEIETFLVHQFSSGWVFLAPNVNWDFLPEPNEDNYEITLKGQIGKMFGHIGFGAESTAFIAGEKSQDLQLRGIFFYYF